MQALASPMSNSLSNTLRPAQTARATHQNFRMRPFVQISEPPVDLATKAYVFKANSSRDITTKISRQKAFCKALFEGGKTSSIPGPAQPNPLGLRLSESKPEEESAEEEKIIGEDELQQYLNGLTVLSELKFDIKLTYEIAHSTDLRSNEASKVGFFFTLQEELKEIQRNELGENMETIELEVIGVVDKYMGYVREIIRSVRRTGDSDTAVILEMTWRCITKLIDSLFRVHLNSIHKLKQENASAIDLLVISHSLEISKLQQEFKTAKDQLRDEIQKLNANIKELKNEINYLRENLSEKENKIQQLTEIDGGFEAMRSMSTLLNNLNGVIDEARNQKRKQKTAMLEISEFVDAANSMSMPPNIRCALSQTDWCIKKDVLQLPKYTEPKLSFHRFLYLDSRVIQIAESQIKQIFFESLKDYSSNTCFVEHFSQKVLGIVESPDEARKFIVNACLKLNKGKDTWIILMRYMLGLEGKVPKVLEIILARITALFISFAKKKDIHFEISVDMYYDMIEKGFNCNRKMRDKLYLDIRLDYLGLELEHLHFEANILNCFLLRLAYYVEKSKKNLKSLFEKTNKPKNSGSNEYVVSQDIFQFVICNKIKMQFSEEEIEAFWDYLEPEPDGTANLMKILNSLQTHENLKIIHHGKISIEEFLLISYKFLLSDFYDQVENLSQINTVTSKDELLQVLSSLNFHLNETQLLSIFTLITLKEDLSDIIDNFSLVVPEILNIGIIQNKRKGRK